MAMILSPSCTPAAPAAGDDAGIVSPSTVFAPQSCSAGLNSNVPAARDGPPRQHAGELGHVRLCVSTVHAERVEFHHLAGIVLVGCAGGLELWSRYASIAGLCALA